MRDRRLLWSLAAVGTLVGHALAYALPHADTGADVHRYLHVVAPLVALIGAGALFALVADGFRGGSPPRLDLVVRYQVFLFVVQESSEALAAGTGPSLTASPAPWLAVGVQVLVALAAVLVVRLVTGTLRGLARSPVPWRLGPANGCVPPSSPGRARRRLPLSIAPRAPPPGSVVM